MNVIGNDWQVTDTESDMEELPSQQEAINKMINNKHNNSDKRKKYKQSKRKNQNANVQSNTIMTRSKTKNGNKPEPTITQRNYEEDSEPWSDDDLNSNNNTNNSNNNNNNKLNHDDSDDSDGLVCTSNNSKYQSSESKTELWQAKGISNPQEYLASEIAELEDGLFTTDQQADNESTSDENDTNSNTNASTKFKIRMYNKK